MGAIINKNKKIIWFLTAFMLGWLWSFNTVGAASYGLKLSSSVTISEDKETTVKQIFSVTGADKTNLPTKATINIIGQQPKGISASGTDNQKLTTQYDSDSNKVTITIPENRRKSAKGWSFSLNYKTQTFMTFGAVDAVQIPALDSNLDVTSQTTTFAADLDLGFATVRSKQPSKTGIGVGQQILTFNYSGAQQESLFIVFGEKSFASVRFSTSLKNNSLWWNEVGLTLPPDTNQQRVVIESIQPTPSRVRLDKDGNIVALFNIGPFGSKQVDITAHLSIDNPTYQLKSAVPIDQTDPLLTQRYTRPSAAWQPLNLEVKVKENATAADVVKGVFDAVVKQVKDEMIGQEEFNLSLRTSALKMSDWLVGELRSRGVPARVVLGMSMSNGNVLGNDPQKHAWVEANVAGVGWVTLDPYFGVYANQYGSADPLRIALALWGIEDDKPPVDLSLATIVFTDEAPEAMTERSQLSIAAKKYVVLPFISIFNQSVSLGAGSIVDGVTLTNSREELVLGSIAPYQKATQRSLLIGGSAFNQETIKAAITGDESSVVEATSSTSYLVLIILVGLVLLIWITKRLRNRKRRQPTTKIRRSKESLTMHDEAVGGEIENENLVTSPDVLPPPISPDSPVQSQPPNRASKLVQ